MAYEMQKSIILICRPAWEMMYKPILPHILAHGIIGNNLDRTAHSHAIAIMVITESGLAVLPEIRNL